MCSKTRFFAGAAMIVMLLGAALFAPKVFFNLHDAANINKTSVSYIDEEDGAVLQPDDADRLAWAARQVEQSDSKNMLALQKKQMTDSERKGLELELSKLHHYGLMQGISLTALADHLVYVAYYNVMNTSSDAEVLSVKEYKFSDYNHFEYSFWADSETGKIYEVTLVDDRKDLELSEMAFMDGVEKYYAIDRISPLVQESSAGVCEYQVSIGDDQITAYYTVFSIYNVSTASFVSAEGGVNWSIFSRSLAVQ